MKICILGPANSIHTVRISNELALKGHEITVCSLQNHRDESGQIMSKTVYLKHGGMKGYYLNVPEFRKFVAEQQFDVINAHYASGYGTLARLARVKPLITSVWGSDIFSFPKKNRFTEVIIKKNLLAADRIFSTSNCMKDEIEKYIGTKREIDITPFGINPNLFCLKKYENRDEDIVTIGFFKGTAEIYGIDIFLDVAKDLKKCMAMSDKTLKFKICGSNVRKDIIKEKIDEYDLADNVEMMGFLEYEKMPEFISSCDIACIPSIEESFGVIALEAMACGVPCVTSSAPGLKEVMIDGITGFVVPTDDIAGYVSKLMSLICEPDKIEEMGTNGRKHIEANYVFSNNINEFVKGYKTVLEA